MSVWELYKFWLIEILNTKNKAKSISVIEIIYLSSFRMALTKTGMILYVCYFTLLSEETRRENKIFKLLL